MLFFKPGRSNLVEIFSKDWSGDYLKDEGGCKDCSAAGDGETVILGLLGVEGSQEGDGAARQEDGKPEDKK